MLVLIIYNITFIYVILISGEWPFGKLRFEIMDIGISGKCPLWDSRIRVIGFGKRKLGFEESFDKNFKNT
jgi:hypothetical protein